MGKRLKGVSYAKWGYIFSIPFVAAFLIFTFYPLLTTMMMGFSDAQMERVIVGGQVDTVMVLNPLDNPVEHFEELLVHNQLFQTSVRNTAFIWIMNFIPQIVLALILTAWFTSRRNKFKGQGLFKVLFYMPNIITAGAIAVLFGVLFNTPIGPANWLLLEVFGMEEIRPGVAFEFHRSQLSSQIIVAFIQFWMWYGYTMLILIAGVLGLNPEMYEVAEIDGAGGIKQFFFITLPNLKTILIFTLVTSTVGGLTMFDIPRLYHPDTVGGPNQATYTVALFIWEQVFRAGRPSLAAAASIIVFAIIALLSVITFYLLRDKDAAQLRKEQRALRRRIRHESKGVA